MRSRQVKRSFIAIFSVKNFSNVRRIDNLSHILSMKLPEIDRHKLETVIALVYVENKRRTRVFTGHNMETANS